MRGVVIWTPAIVAARRATGRIIPTALRIRVNSARECDGKLRKSEGPRHRGMRANMAELSDKQLRSRLEAYGLKNHDHWSFRGNATRHHAHAYFQYPAMMVPQMVGDLLAAVTDGNDSFRHAYDPFAGSGTALTEAIMRGLDFTGKDINPLAVLLCQARTIPFFDAAIEERLSRLITAAHCDNSVWIEAEFPNRRKWFADSVAVELSRLQRAIRREDARWARRFFWVALAETVRLTSNSRTSTFKLHIRPKTEIESRRVSPLGVFENIRATKCRSPACAKKDTRRPWTLGTRAVQGQGDDQHWRFNAVLAGGVA